MHSEQVTCDVCGGQQSSGWWAIDHSWGSLFVLELLRWHDVARGDSRPLWHACSESCVLAKVTEFMKRSKRAMVFKTRLHNSTKRKPERAGLSDRRAGAKIK